MSRSLHFLVLIFAYVEGSSFRRRRKKRRRSRPAATLFETRKTFQIFHSVLSLRCKGPKTPGALQKVSKSSPFSSRCCTFTGHGPAGGLRTVDRPRPHSRPPRPHPGLDRRCPEGDAHTAEPPPRPLRRLYYLPSDSGGGSGPGRWWHPTARLLTSSPASPVPATPAVWSIPQVEPSPLPPETPKPTTTEHDAPCSSFLPSASFSPPTAAATRRPGGRRGGGGRSRGFGPSSPADRRLRGTHR